MTKGLLGKFLGNLGIDTICIFDSVQQTRQSIQERNEVNVAGKRNMTLQKGGLELPPGHFISVSQCQTTNFHNGPLNKYVKFYLDNSMPSKLIRGEVQP